MKIHMNETSLDFHIGDFQCFLVADGTHSYPEPAALLFSNAPATELRGELSHYGISLEDWTHWVSDYTCVVIESGKQRILLDAGAGSMLPEAGKLASNMRLAGIFPETVDLLLISHAHPDHLGGAVHFPNAKIIMSRDEWLFWTQNPMLPRLPHDFRMLLTGMVSHLLDSVRDRLELIDGISEIAPGINMLQAPGHTPGHMAVHIASGSEHFVYAGDAVLHPIHIRKPHWNALVDVLPDKSIQTRYRLLSLATESDAAFFGFHMSHLGKITNHGCTFKWIAHDGYAPL